MEIFIIKSCDSIYKYKNLPFLWHRDKMTIGYGRFSCTGWTNKHHGEFVTQIGVKEEGLASCFYGGDDQVTHLKRSPESN